ncbi:SgrR family transcriptional regulator [Lihuaxuella thermophila]
MIERYFDLRQIYPDVKENVPFPVRVAELAEILCCSPRNVKHLLKKMETAGFIKWEPGKGRGNRSKLTFTLPLGTVVIYHFKDLLNKGKVDQGIQFIHRKGVPENIRKMCFNHLQSQYRSAASDTKKQQDLSKKLFQTFPVMRHLVRQIHDTSPWFISTRPAKASSFIWPNHGNQTDL